MLEDECSVQAAKKGPLDMRVQSNTGPYYYPCGAGSQMVVHLQYCSHRLHQHDTPDCSES